MRAWIVTGMLALSFCAQDARAQGKFDFLKPLEVKKADWVPEQSSESVEAAAPVLVDLSEFYEEFEADGVVTFDIGFGYEAWFPERAPQLYNMLVSLANQWGTPLVDWDVSDDWRTIRFKHARRGTKYVIRIGTERDSYMEAFSKYEVVLYHGHSRYGQGPAFQGFQNYFRIGSNFDTIEVDTRNGYFRDEPILKTDRYPVKDVTVNGKELPYQYRGQKDHRSYLPDDSFTKIIPGRHADLLTTTFLPGRQIFYFYSCKNRKYWRDSIREVLPDPRMKAVFGTQADAWGGTAPDALMIMEVVWREEKSSNIIENLNATGDCANCFTAY